MRTAIISETSRPITAPLPLAIALLSRSAPHSPCCPPAVQSPHCFISSSIREPHIVFADFHLQPLSKSTALAAVQRHAAAGLIAKAEWLRVSAGSPLSFAEKSPLIFYLFFSFHFFSFNFGQSAAAVAAAAGGADPERARWMLAVPPLTGRGARRRSATGPLDHWGWPLVHSPLAAVTEPAECSRDGGSSFDRTARSPQCAAVGERTRPAAPEQWPQECRSWPVVGGAVLCSGGRGRGMDACCDPLAAPDPSAPSDEGHRLQPTPHIHRRTDRWAQCAGGCGLSAQRDRWPLRLDQWSAGGRTRQLVSVPFLNLRSRTRRSLRCLRVRAADRPVVAALLAP